MSNASKKNPPFLNKKGSVFNHSGNGKTTFYYNSFTNSGIVTLNNCPFSIDHNFLNTESGTVNLYNRTKIDVGGDFVNMGTINLTNSDLYLNWGFDNYGTINFNGFFTSKFGMKVPDNANNSHHETAILEDGSVLNLNTAHHNTGNIEVGEPVVGKGGSTTNVYNTGYIEFDYNVSLQPTDVMNFHNIAGNTGDLCATQFANNLSGGVFNLYSGSDVDCFKNVSKTQINFRNDNSEKETVLYFDSNIDTTINAPIIGGFAKKDIIECGFVSKISTVSLFQSAKSAEILINGENQLSLSGVFTTQGTHNFSLSDYGFYLDCNNGHKIFFDIPKGEGIPKFTMT